MLDHQRACTPHRTYAGYARYADGEVTKKGHGDQENKDVTNIFFGDCTGHNEEITIKHDRILRPNI